MDYVLISRKHNSLGNSGTVKQKLILRSGKGAQHSVIADETLALHSGIPYRCH